MDVHITEIEVDFSSEEMSTIRKVYSIPGVEAPVEKASDIRRISELETILNDVEYVLSEDLDTDERTDLLRLRKDLKNTLEHFEKGQA